MLNKLPQGSDECHDFLCQKEKYVHIHVALRKHLHLFKGSKLAVLLSLAHHCDESGWVLDTEGDEFQFLSTETGYHRVTVAYTLSELCRIRIDDRHVLMKY